MQLKKLTTLIKEEIILKGSDFFTTPQGGFDYRYGKTFLYAFNYKNYILNVYHNHSGGENHVLARFKERITTGESRFRDPITGNYKIIKDLLQWQTHSPSILPSIIKKAIIKIENEFGLEEEDLNAYLIIDNKNYIALRVIITGVENENDLDDFRDRRQVLIQTIEIPDMIHKDGEFYDIKTDREFIEFDTITLHENNMEQNYIIIHI